MFADSLCRRPDAIMDNLTEFKHTHTGDDGFKTVRTSSTNALTWLELLEEFEDFLRGCGFFLNGHFELVEDEGANEKEERV